MCEYSSKMCSLWAQIRTLVHIYAFNNRKGSDNGEFFWVLLLVVVHLKPHIKKNICDVETECHGLNINSTQNNPGQQSESLRSFFTSSLTFIFMRSKQVNTPKWNQMGSQGTQWGWLWRAWILALLWSFFTSSLTFIFMRSRQARASSLESWPPTIMVKTWR